MWSLLLKHDELERMKASRFRRKWHLDELDKKRLLAYGFVELEKHARAVIEDRIRTKPMNDGEQTPYKGHPVFKVSSLRYARSGHSFALLMKAMHATATCCRRCIFSWHRIPPYKCLM